MFDKLLYWKRRKAGERGQEDLPKPEGGHVFGYRGQAVSDKQLTKKALLKNTKRARKLTNV